MAATDTKKPDRAGYAKGASKEGAASDEKFDPSKGFDDFAESAEKRANCFSRMVRACWERMLVWRDVHEAEVRLAGWPIGQRAVSVYQRWYTTVKFPPPTCSFLIPARAFPPRLPQIFWYVGQVLEVGAATTQTKGGMDHSDLWRMMEQDQSGVVLEGERQSCHRAAVLTRPLPPSYIPLPRPASALAAHLTNSICLGHRDRHCTRLARHHNYDLQ